MTPTPIEGAARLIVVVGPSGAGKDSVVRAWLSLPRESPIHLARRSITRPPHADSEDHEALSVEQFAAESARGAFAFTWSAHHLHYGVRWSELAGLSRGEWVVLNGSRAHLPRLRDQAPAAHVVALEASAAVRRKRLGTRGRESDASIAGRLEREAPSAAVDLTIGNDGALEQAVQMLEAWWQGRLDASSAPTTERCR